MGVFSRTHRHRQKSLNRSGVTRMAIAPARAAGAVGARISSPCIGCTEGGALFVPADVQTAALQLDLVPLQSHSPEARSPWR
jgi:hypothetical protein